MSKRTRAATVTDHADTRPDSMGRTIRDELLNLRKMYPVKNGLRLKQRNAPNRAKFATLWVLLRDDNRASVHASLFVRKSAVSASEWDDFFKRKVLHGTNDRAEDPARRMGILSGAIIPGANIRSGGVFELQAVVGYALHQSIPSKILSAWNQAKR